MPRIIKQAAFRDVPVVIEYEKIRVTDEQNRHEEPAIEGAAGEVPHPASSERAAAEDEVAGFLSRAQEEARQLVADAAQAAEQLRIEAEQQGYAEGQEAGYQEGYRRGEEQAEQAVRERLQTELQRAVEQAQQVVLLAEREARELILDAEKEIVEIALAASRRLTLRDFERDNSGIVDIVIEALRKVKDKEQIVIRVNPEEYDVLLAARRELDAITGDEKALTVMADLAVQRNGCVIETPHGTVDAQLDTKFEMLRKALLEVLGR